MQAILSPSSASFVRSARRWTGALQHARSGVSKAPPGCLGVSCSVAPGSCMISQPECINSNLLSPELSRRHFSGVCQAKGKKKKGGKKGGKKKAGSLMDPPAPTVEPWFSTDSIMRLLLLAENYKRATGKFLLENADIANIAKDIWEAPFCLAMNDMVDDDSPPKLTYANKPFLECMDLNWNDVVGKSASDIPDTIKILFEDWMASVAVGEKEVLMDGFASKAKNFEIGQATTFVLKSPSDKPLGQVLVFDKWTYDDGTRGGVGITDPQKVPTEEDVSNAEAAVNEQAQVVRILKEEKGLTNQDDEVKEAVAILLERKDKVSELQKLLEEAPTAQA